MNKPIDDILFPAAGDNFALSGPWRITTGHAWQDWQAAAIEAEIRAAHANKDAFGAHRSAVRLRRFRAGEDDRTPTLRNG